MITKECKEVLESLAIKKFIEAGTDMGETVGEVARWFSESTSGFGKVAGYKKSWARCYNAWNEPIEYPVFEEARDSEYKVYSCDLDPYSYETARENFRSNPNIVISNLSSEIFIDQLIRTGQLSMHETHFFFLDTHWVDPWPLPKEIEAICQLDKFIIGIDDFMVPGKSSLKSTHCDFGYTIHKGWVLNWGLIKDLFPASKAIRIFYPRLPSRDKRGWVMLACGLGDDEISKLERLGFFEVAADDPLHSVKQKLPLVSYFDHVLLARLFVPMSVLRPTIRLVHRLRWKLGV